MPIDYKRYPKNWQEIAIEAKNAADWQCQHCRRHCLRPGEKRSLTRSEWTRFTLSVHHSDCTPENNQPENLIALCTPCHLALHGRGRRSNVSPGQLSLW